MAPISTAESAPPTRPTPDGAPAPVGAERRVALAGLALLLGYLPTLWSFGGTWNSQENAYGFLVAGAVVWLVWRDRSRIVRLSDGGLPDLYPLLGLLAFGWLCATIMGVRLVHQASFLALATVWAVTVFGWRARVPVLEIAATAFLALPLWALAAPVLQRGTVIVAGALTKAAGISAEIGVDTIAISSGVFLVEEGCAGIRYLTAALTLGALYGHLFAERWQTKLKIVAVAAAFSIVGNWIRVTVLVFLGEATAMQSPHIEDHLWQGWVIFTVLMVPAYAVARRIELSDRRRFGAPDEGEPASGAVLGSSARIATTAALVALAGPALYVAVSVVPRGDTLERDPEVFDVVDVFTPTPSATPDAWRPDFVGVDDRAEWTFTVEGRTVHAARHYYVDQRQGDELIQWANAIAPDSLLVTERLFGPLGPNRRLVREAIVQTEGLPRVAWYWYRVAGVDTPFPSRAKLLEIPAFFRRSAAAELVTMSVECGRSDCTEAATTLRRAVGISTGS